MVKERSLKCWICGNEATRKRDLRSPQPYWSEYFHTTPVRNETQRCYCDGCYEKVMQELKEENELYIKLKKKRMFETAVDHMEHQHINLYEYKDAIDTVQEYFENNLDKFDSSYEVMAAIVLIYNHIHIKPQAKVGKYQVDFLLDDDHIVLEIDGERHKHRKKYDADRDFDIKKILGQDWDIIRINTTYLDQKVTKLVDAINNVIDFRETGHIPWRSI